MYHPSTTLTWSKVFAASPFLLLLSVTTALSQSADRLGGFEYPRKSELLKPDYKGSYERVAVKKDIYLMRPTVVIDEPLRSNGGNILIVANEVSINAPIDARLQFVMKSNYWIPKPAPPNLSTPLDDFFFESPAVKSAFDSLYLWRDTYDPQQRRYVFAVGAREPPTNQITLHQLPSAEVPLAPDTPYGNNITDVRPADGPNAPDQYVSWSSVRSGNIRIYASKVTLCDDCIRALEAKRPEDGDPEDFNRGVFFHSGGLKGGRGAAGSLSYCAGRTSCNAVASRNGGLSGLPGRGGDGGDIDIVLVNYEGSESEKALQFSLLEKASNVDGGVPAHRHRLRTSSFNAVHASGKRSAFIKEVAVPDAEKLIGAKGKFTVREATTDVAVNEITAYLATSDISSDYDIRQMLESARQTSKLASFLPSDSLRFLLMAELVRLQLTLTNSVAASLRNETASVQFSPFFKTLSCKSESYVGISAIDREYLRRICQFAQIEGVDAVRGYFYRVEGLFRTVPRDVNVGIRHDEVADQIDQSQKLLTILIDEVSKSRETLYSQISGETRETMQNALRELVAQNEKLLAAAQKPRGNFMKDVVGPAQSMGNDFAAAYAAAIAEQWPIAAMKAYEGWKKFARLIGNQRGVRAPLPVDLQNEIDQMRAAIDAFAAVTYATRETMLANQLQNMRRLVELRGNIDRRTTEYRFKFEDAIRAAIQDYLQSPSNEWGRLDTNLRIIRSSLESTQSPFASLDVALRNQCQNQPAPIRISEFRSVVGCAALERGGSSGYVYISKLDRAKDFPLIVVASKRSFSPI